MERKKTLSKTKIILFDNIEKLGFTPWTRQYKQRATVGSQAAFWQVGTPYHVMPGSPVPSFQAVATARGHGISCKTV